MWLEGTFFCIPVGMAATEGTKAPGNFSLPFQGHGERIAGSSAPLPVGARGPGIHQRCSGR
eukprot:4722415-Prymnesium_polylepis.1